MVLKKFFMILSILLFLMLGVFIVPGGVRAADCEYDRDSNGVLIVVLECPDGYVEKPTKITNMYEVPDCECVPEVPGDNCTKEGGIPTPNKPCCSGTHSFSYPYGAMCVKDGTDPYHNNCITTGRPGQGQTCCDGSFLNTNGKCEIYNALCEDVGIKTALGCIPVLSSTDDFLGVVLKFAVGIGGGIAFALMLYAGFMIMTASGNPERIKAGQELLTSAVAGLILLVFSVFILRFIGVDILGLNQFGFNQ